VLVSDSALCEERSGKAPSDCLAVNLAVGCTHGFRWGTYFYVKPGLEEAIGKTPWAK